MVNRTLRWMLIAVGLAAWFGLNNAHARSDPPAALPAGVIACEFAALARSSGLDEPSIKDAPRDDGRVLGSLAAIKDEYTDAYGPTGELPEFQVAGFKDGWFLIEDAGWPQANRPTLDPSRGWIEARFVTTHLFRDTLKKAPDNASPDVTWLHGTTDGVTYRPYDLDAQVVGCFGRWLEVEIHQPDAKTLSGKPVSADGTVRGWTDRSCVEQTNGPCRGTQFDYPWSPLPAGVTECNFRALSNDPDPAGLNVHDAPGSKAGVLGRLSPPVDIGGGTKVLTEVQVIGYREGWFLIEAGPYNAADLPPHRPKPYSGRGWVAGAMLTTELLRDMLKQGPSETSADVVDLTVDNVSDPQTVKMRRILACSGDWVHVEIALMKGMQPLIATDAAKGAIRGWSNGNVHGATHDL